jgi:Holliday junction resolvasome RuvABC endonuclease subunit
MKLNVVGQDPSLRHWGIAQGVYDTVTRILTIQNVSVTEPVLVKTKQVRQNSLDLEAAKQLCEGALAAAKTAQVTFVEVPVGSQTARAMASYGICVGVLGALRATGIPIFEVSPTEVKQAGAGKATASKSEMIDWAIAKHPEANWPRYKQKGDVLVCNAKAEHQADAIAAIYAGLASNSFKQLLPLLEVAHGKSHHANPIETA